MNAQETEHPSPASSGTTVPTSTAPQDDEQASLREKYKLLKKRVREIEEDNDIISMKLAKAKRQIKRLRVERIVLLEELDQSRSHGQDKKLLSDSDNSGDESPTSEAPITVKKTKGSRNVGSKQQTHEGTATPAKKKRDPNAPKGPGNVFFLYCRLERDKMKDEVPNESLGEVTRLLGQKWKALSKEEKKKYYDMYNKELKEYEDAMKEYNAAGGGAAGEASTTAGQKDKDAKKIEDDEDVDMLHEEDDDELEKDDNVGEQSEVPNMSTNNVLPNPSPSLPQSNGGGMDVAPSTAPLPEPASSEAPIDQLAGIPPTPIVSSVHSPENNAQRPTDTVPQANPQDQQPQP